MVQKGVPGRVSCILVAADDEHYVGYSALSLLDHVDELVVVDLGSRDGSRAVLQQVAAQWDPQGKLFIEPVAAAVPASAAVSMALARCSGDWVLLLRAGQVYDEPTGERIERWLRSQEIHSTVCSLGWPRFRFGDEQLQRIATFAEPHTVCSFAVRNLEGLHLHGEDLHRDWRDAAGQPVGIDHVAEHSSIVTCGFGVHDYAAARDPGCRQAVSMPFEHGHPEVFWRHDLRPWMQSPEFVDPSRLAVQQAHLARPVLLTAPASVPTADG